MGKVQMPIGQRDEAWGTMKLDIGARAGWTTRFDRIRPIQKYIEHTLYSESKLTRCQSINQVREALTCWQTYWHSDFQEISCEENIGCQFLLCYRVSPILHRHDPRSDPESIFLRLSVHNNWNGCVLQCWPFPNRSRNLYTHCVLHKSMTWGNLRRGKLKRYHKPICNQSQTVGRPERGAFGEWCRETSTFWYRYTPTKSDTFTAQSIIAIPMWQTCCTKPKLSNQR